NGTSAASLSRQLEAKEADKTHQDEALMSAAISLICEWAQRVLMRQFDTVVDLARFLVKEHLISPRTKNAAVVMEEVMTENILQSQKDPKLRQRPKNAGQESEEKTQDPQPKQTEGPKGAKPNSPSGKEDRPGPKRVKQTTAADVDSVINRYPPIWPKTQVKKLLAISTASCVAQPAVPVRMCTPVPLAMPPGSNSAGLVAAGPLPLLKKVTVILPGSVWLPGQEGGGRPPPKIEERTCGPKADRTTSCHPPKSSAAAPHKRPASPPGEKQASKRKRGRPRKVVGGQQLQEGSAGAAAGGAKGATITRPAAGSTGPPESSTPNLPLASPAPKPPNAAAAILSPPPAPSSPMDCSGKPAAPDVPTARLDPQPRKNIGPSEPRARKTSVIRPVWPTGRAGGWRTRSPTHTTPNDHQ
ncbi:nascent polypeptide-associated complex subunit alpha, muscle-specific form-like, partial [Scyliorhinus canicula]|uniref:nascent polypeptide-associated complex subunit alpha, muscle-specific form-like n=1 Tax=Scyliorhinus canicula TaxID=7830 RepID=UPI0018F4275D